MSCSQKTVWELWKARTLCCSLQSAPKRTEKRTGSNNVPQHMNGLRYVTTEAELSDDEYLFLIGDAKQAATVPHNHWQHCDSGYY